MTLSQVHDEITKLQAARDALESKRRLLASEEVKVLADAFARKLLSSGLSIEDGIAALRPYVSLAKSKVNATTGNSPVQSMSVLGLAKSVLGADAEDWFRRPNALLAGEVPADFVKQRAGEHKVRELLRALKGDDAS